MHSHTAPRKIKNTKKHMPHVCKQRVRFGNKQDRFVELACD